MLLTHVKPQVREVVKSLFTVMILFTMTVGIAVGTSLCVGNAVRRWSHHTDWPGVLGVPNSLWFMIVNASCVLVTC